MPQKLNLSPEQLSQAKNKDMSEEYIPALEGAKHYLCYAETNGIAVMTIFKDGEWKLTSQAELFNIINGM